MVPIKSWSQGGARGPPPGTKLEPPGDQHDLVQPDTRPENRLPPPSVVRGIRPCSRFKGRGSMKILKFHWGVDELKSLRTPDLNEACN